MTEQRFALLIASYRYQDPDLSQLVAPAEDAEALARVLDDPTIGGFDVQTVINQPSHLVARTVEEFFADRRLDDLLLFYFTGHGLKDDQGRLFFAMANTERRFLGATALPAAFVNEVMDQSRSRRNVLLLDCCYSGAFAAGRSAKGDPAIHTPERFRSKGRVVLTASDAMQFSFEGDRVSGQGIQSVFTRLLVQGLETGEADRNGDGEVDLDELYAYVDDRMREEMPQQRPGKWQWDVQGSIVIARNPTPKPPEGLPRELREALASPFAGIRHGAVAEVGRLLSSEDPTVAAAAEAALHGLVGDDSRLVSQAAKVVLAKREAEAALARETKERIAREAVEHARAAMEPVRGAEARTKREAEENAERAAKRANVDTSSGPLRQRSARVEPSGQAPASEVSSRRWRRPSLITAAGVVIVALVAWGIWATTSDGAGRRTSQPSPTTSASPIGAWEPGPDLLTPVEAAGVASHKGAIWVIGGDTLASPNMTRDVQVLDPSRGRWAKGPSLPVPLRDAVAISTGETLYVLGGITTNGVIDAVYRLDESRRRWIVDPRALPEPRAAGAGAWDGTRLLFAGGVDSTNHDRPEVWALGANGWELVATLSQPRNSLGAASDGAGTTWLLAGQLNRTAASGKIAATGAVDRLRGETISPERPVRARRAVSAAFIPGAGPCVVGGVPHLSRTADPTVECPFAPPGIKVPPLRTARAGIGTALLDGQLFAVGGFSHFGQNGSVTVEVLPLR